MIPKNLIKKICQTITKQFPGYAHIKPEVTVARIKPQTAIFQKLSMGVPRRHATVYKMRFKKKITTEDAVVLKKILTVTFNNEGNILKITESK